LSKDEVEPLTACALRKHGPWIEWSGKREKPRFEVVPVFLHIPPRERISKLSSIT
jgi:hypothetical protein